MALYGIRRFKNINNLKYESSSECWFIGLILKSSAFDHNTTIFIHVIFDQLH